MELPHLGKHCECEGCNQLDFLPFKCQFCSSIYCQDHRLPQSHSCTQIPQDLDAKAIVCPVCNKVVPVNRGEDPNLRVSEHIQRGCPDPGSSTSTTKIFSNTCSMRGCKGKSAVPLLCPSCNKNHCIKHRLEQDHKCGRPNSPSPPRKSGVNSSSTTNSSSSLKNSSRNASSKSLNHLSEDEQMNLAMQRSLEEQQQQQQQQNTCVLS